MDLEKINNSFDSRHSALNGLSTLFFYLSVLFFIIGFNFTDVPPGPFWYQQFMPSLNNQPLSDLFFVDSLNGWAVTSIHTLNDSGYILKTTNSGNNWSIKFKNRNYFQRIKFINALTGFTCGTDQGAGVGFLYKSTDGGENWFGLNVPGGVPVDDMSILNQDTIWFASGIGLLGGVFRTTNGGASWLFQQGFGSNPNKIYMFDKNLGFAGETFTLQRTTDGGFNWTQINGENGFIDMYFVDSLTGWKSNDYINNNDSNMRKTTNGGLNWSTQILPSGGFITSSSSMYKFSKISRDTILGTGGVLQYSLNRSRGFIYTTTNGGDNWLFQMPDTSFGIPAYITMNFVNTKIGWAYTNFVPPSSGNFVYTGIHTTTGGDTTFYLPVRQISSNVPKQFSLYQNYPNPFNPITEIKYDLKSQTAVVKLIVFDILGKTISTLIDQKQNAGAYEVDFSGNNLASGIYFYSLIVDGNVIDTKKMMLIK